MRSYATIILALSLWSTCLPQSLYTVMGTVSDSISGETLIGASIRTGGGKGIISDNLGNFILRLSEPEVTLSCQYLGYSASSIKLDFKDSDTLFLQIRLKESSTPLDEVVVSANRYEQRLAEVMVSMDIIQPERILNTSTTTLESVLRQTPGVEVLDGQPSIRGGSGYSYGAGSRVMVLMDNMPLMTGDVGDVKWDYLPVENIGHIEIIKGASSVLYGSSALNGVFHLRSKFPKLQPETMLSLYSGIYLEPSRKETVWWDKNPILAGLDFSHTRKIKNLDLVLSGNLFRDKAHREHEYHERARMGIRLRQNSAKLPGLAYGLNLNGMLTRSSDFLLWRDSRTGALRQNPQTVSELRGNRFNVDPFIEYSGRKSNRHSLRGRVYNIENRFPDAPDKNNRSAQVFGEYLYKKDFTGRFNVSLGISGSYTNVISELYGDHTAANLAGFGQLDGRLSEGLNATLGIRFERFAVDNETEYSIPVLRAGVNYQLAEYTFLRASFGQGYRFPSVAEKYTATNVGSLKIFPNPDLESESGWSSEIGIKQGIRINEWNAYADLSVFWTEYRNMIEYIFDLYPADTSSSPSLDDYGFMAMNVGKARITGFEISLYGDGKIGRFPLSLIAGYTFIEPLDVQAADTISGREYTSLKYRYRHSFKTDAELGIGRFRTGFTLILNSRMDRIDDVFTDPLFGNIILPGFPAYWEENNTGFAVLDLRVLCNITSWLNVGGMWKNILNNEYMGRPGDIRAPGNITLRLTAEF